ncbi:hypothetical protein SAMN02745181_2900 [Rubritalea squalenifaciens DSM 18772]|uniref:Uncharacterized protein n=1 Tax=Rubritalea squalenifaciens DSM 18772 TaxID=1123071 RepID=A0A1M6NM70_9BACT|nr:hypothetical protein [Rubritalea squalenifaciens]SHJ96775.1 hypothetical protein SAMN02745181_2900 [Rubritalea squalenifaciens DSM 18772]
MLLKALACYMADELLARYGGPDGSINMAEDVMLAAVEAILTAGMSKAGSLAKLMPKLKVLREAIADGRNARKLSKAMDGLDLLDADLGSNAIERSINDIFINPERVWNKKPIQRGIDIEDSLATTDYKDWFRAGQLDDGMFPLVDFQLGDNLVSLKSIDTNGSTWTGRMEKHINDLALGHEVNDAPANMILDIRVQPGGASDAASLIEYGAERGVDVMVSEFK